MRRFTVAERRARLGRRHHLAGEARAEDVVQVARGLVALHATDPATVFLSAAARMREPSLADIEHALYVERRLVRMLGMRRTVFVVPVELAPVVQVACTRAIAVQQRKLLVVMLERAGLDGDIDAWISDVETSTLAALHARGEATAAQLAEDEPRLRQQVLLAAGKSYAGYQSISTRILFQLAADGQVVRGRPLGSWISTLYRWAPADAWLPDGWPDLATDAAQAALVGSWLAAFGPAPVSDIRWWSGLTAGQVNRALASVGAVEVELEGARAVALPNDLDPVPAPDPWVALLPALDPTVMGWSAREWFLGPHGPDLFDRSGNVGPTIWSDGRIVGGWAQRKSGEIVTRLLEDVGIETQQAIEAAAERVCRWIGPIRVTPRFRTPLERELSA